MSRAGGESTSSNHPQETGRLDRWLWFARVVKSRTLAAGLVEDGKVRLNRERIAKPSQTIRIGDVLTVRVGPRVRVLRVAQLGHRRGPPAEAQTLYEELQVSATEPGEAAPTVAQRAAGAGRPTKRERRQLGLLKNE